jgi:zinc protease
MRRLFWGLSLMLSLIIMSCDWFSVPANPDLRPQVGHLDAHNLAVAEHLSLANGLPLTVIEDDLLPIVNATIILHHGRVNDPAGIPGLSEFVLQSLRRGTTSRSAAEFNREFAATGAEVRFDVGLETTRISISVLRETAEAAIALSADALLNPAFAAFEVDRIRESLLNANEHARDGYALTRELLFKVLFGNHIYARNVMGNDYALENVSPSALRSFHQQYYVAKRAAIVFSGNIRLSEARQWGEKYFAAMPRGDQATPAVAIPPPARVLKIHFVALPGTKMATVRIGMHTFPANDDRAIMVTLGRELLAGSSASRIPRRLRGSGIEDFNFVFGFLPLRSASIISTVGDFPNARVDSAVQVILTAIDSLAQQPIAEAELTRAKRILSGRFYLETETAAQLAERYSELVMFNLPEDYLPGFARRVNAIDSESFQRGWQQMLAGREFAIIVAGDPGVIPVLQKIAPVRIYDENLLAR